MQEDLWKKKQQEEQEEQARLKNVTGRIGFTRRRIGAFQGTMGSHTAGLEESPSVGCADTVTAGQLHNQSKQMLQSANKQVSEQEQKMRMATEQLQVSYSSLNRLLNHVGIEEALQLEQVEEILRQEADKLTAGINTNEERLLRLNSFGYPLLTEEQMKLQKLSLTRQQNIRQIDGNADENKGRNRTVGERNN